VKINWNNCQQNSDQILCAGIFALESDDKQPLIGSFPNGYGNYLISDESHKITYIGEARNLFVRLKQHSRKSSSTFFKNYQKKAVKYPPELQGFSIEDFGAKVIHTNIGRKGMEEFGIVNIPTNLNRFQLGKRNRFFGETPPTELWDEVQNAAEVLLEEGEVEMKSERATSWFDAKVTQRPGVYWIENNEKELIYIGESSDVHARYKAHSGTTYFSAFRRHVGEDILGYKLQTRKGKKRYFEEGEDLQVTEYIKQCSFKAISVFFGRYELEEYLIGKEKPLLNRK
jgi:predicted GIY-YIG superfamily endonuclease